MLALEVPMGMEVGQARARAFISYSRKDLAIAERVRDELVRRAFDAFLDKHDILPGEPWQERLGKLIEAADTVVFLLSRNSVASAVCDWEVNEAERLGKRLLPVIIDDVADDAIPGRLKRLNYIFHRGDTELSKGLDDLEAALLTDIVWIREHTRLSELANRWQGANRPRHLLLSKPDLVAAESWRDRRPPTAPDCTLVQLDLISQSREHASRIARRWFAGSVLTTILFAGVAVVAVQQRSIAVDQKAEATRQRDAALIGQSRFLADQAKRSVDAGDALTGALLALEALPDAAGGRERPYEPRAEAALMRAYHAIREKRKIASDDQAPIVDAAFLPDGQHVVAISRNGKAYLGGVAPGSTVTVYQTEDAQQQPIVHVTTGSDGLLLFIVERNADGRIAFDLHRGVVGRAELSRLPVRVNGEVTALRSAIALAPDGARFAVLDEDGKTHEFRRDAGVADIVHASRVDARLVKYLDDRPLVATIDRERVIRLVDAATGAVTAELRGHTDVVNDVAFSVDGSLVVTSAGHRDRDLVKDGTARVWERTSGKQVAVLTGHRASVVSASFNHDATRVLTLSNDGTQRIWDTRSGREVSIMGEDLVVTASFSPDGRHVLTAAKDGSARLRFHNGQLHQRFGSHEMELHGAEFSPDRTTVATWSDDGTLRLWSSDKPLGLLGLPYGTHKIAPDVMISDMRFSRDSRTVFAATRWSLDAIDVATGQVRGSVRPDSFPVFLTLPATDGVVAAAADGTVLAWDGRSSEAERLFSIGTAKPVRLEGHGGSPVLAAVREDHALELWDVEQRRVIVTFKGHGGAVRAAALAPDGKSIATASSDGTVRVWARPTGQEIRKLADGAEAFGHVAFSHDGRFLVAGGRSNRLKVWNIETGAVVYEPHDVESATAEFSAGSDRLIYGDRSGRAVVVGVRDWRQVFEFVASETYRSSATMPVLHAAFAPDSRSVAFADLSGNLQTWRFFTPLDRLIAETKSASNRCLTPDQRKRAFLTDEVPAWCRANP